jgi:hypothetical protein
MARSAKSRTEKPTAEDQQTIQHYCALPPVAPPVYDEVVTGPRLDAINRFGKLWANGTQITYHLFSNGALAGSEADKAETRKAFQTWKNQGIGLEFKEVESSASAMLRIGYVANAGSWSYVGTDNLGMKTPGERTMNFGWPLTTAYGRDTALHEIGHALGLSHEHQNPNAGIVWNEPRVRQYFAGPPNNWTQSQIERNILNKLDAGHTVGSTWDPDSIMEYQFPAGMIDVPPIYRTRPLVPAGGLSKLDKDWVRSSYPPLKQSTPPALSPFESQLVAAASGGLSQFSLKPRKSGKVTIRLFGESDATLLLYEVGADGERYVAGASDAGNAANSEITERLHADRTYLVKVMVIYAPEPNALSVMYW